MALWSRIYFNAVFGALGGLLGWMLFGVLGDRTPSAQPVLLFLSHTDLNLLLGGALIGGLIGYFVVGVDAIRDQSALRFARLASMGLLLSCVGGALGMYLGDLVNYVLINRLGDHLVVTLVSRALGWSLLGCAIGLSDGVAARSLGKLSYGAIGGLIGGFAGGVLFELFYAFARQTGATTYFWNAMGLVVLGACIGSLTALVQAVFQPASLKVLRGWQEGREYGLDKDESSLGRSEHSDIAIFRDMQVEKKHAIILRRDGRYFLVKRDAPAEATLVNEKAVADQRELQDGDRIQLGNVLMKFQLREAKAASPRKPDSLKTASRSSSSASQGTETRRPSSEKDSRRR